MKKVKLFIIVLLLIFVMPVVSAKSMKATDYIQKIADDAGGNKNSVEVIGNTGLAYDGTTDNNLRYVGGNPSNYIWFNDEMWRVIGVMNNVKDNEGNKATRLKLIRFQSIAYTCYDARNLAINPLIETSNNYLRGAGVNEWSESNLYKLLNPGYEDNIYSDYSSTAKVNNSLYWNRQNGMCLYYKRTYSSWTRNYTNSLSTSSCDYRDTGLKDDYKKYISNISWNTGTVPNNFREKKPSEIYSYERGEALKCNANETTCNDTVQRKSSTNGRVGLLYPSDQLYSIKSSDGSDRAYCLDQSINSLMNYSNNRCYYSNAWLAYHSTLTPLYDPDFGNKYVSSDLGSFYTSDSVYNIYPVIYLEPNTKIVGGTGDKGSPFIIGDSNYQDITNDSNKKVTAKYKGNYSIDYLISNYNIITFGTKKNNLPQEFNNNIATKKGDVTNLTKVEGPVLINNSFTTNSEKCDFSTKNNNDESFIKGELGDNMITPSKVVTNKDYVDFDKMYAQVVNEQQELVEKTEYNINKEIIEISTPGIYMINNTKPYSGSNNNYSSYYIYNNTSYSSSVSVKSIYINDYDTKNNYVFNIMNLFDLNDYVVFVKSSEDPAFKKIEDLINEGNYTGNIIFNYPNARYLELRTLFGTIIAPKADIYMPQLFLNDNLQEYNNVILANSISGRNIKIKYFPHKNNKKLLNEMGKQYVVESEDFNDDLYTYDYSLKSLLENYNIISLGKHNYQDNTKFKTLGYKKGSTALFHIDGQFLVNGDLGTNVDNYPGYTTNNGNNSSRNTNLMRFDLDSNLVTESCVKGEFKTGFYIKNWKTNVPEFGSKNNLFIKSDSDYNSNYYYGYNYGYNYGGGAIAEKKDFVNFDRLYDNIVAQQKAIKQGQDVDVQNGKAHIKIGSNYVISNINDINEIVFDNFENNKNKLTVITIQNSGDINFPKMSADTIGLIETNDYYGKKEATYQYEINRDFNDKYHGNIIWNIPNATYIKLAANAPFAGHLIAPKADVESPETHFSGCFIVNSLYCEGNTEAHFYPLTTTKIDEYYIDKNGDGKTKEMDFSLTLGEETSILDYNVIGDYQQYLRDLKKNPIREILTNPKTYRNLGIVLFLLFVVGAVLHIYKKNKEMIK